MVAQAAQDGRAAVPKPAAAAAAAAGERATRRAALAAIVAGIAAVGSGPAAANQDAPRMGEISHTDAEWRKLLPKDSYAVLRQARTEAPFFSPLYKEKRAGMFACAGCGSPVFPSETKFESGTGWPSFFDVVPNSVALESDSAIPFMPRIEVRCSKCLGHLGHVFRDGPPPTGLRFCMNGAALRFEPKEA